MIIAQISDTHILARSSDLDEGRRRADDLRRCVADINRQQPDAVVHTGDIVQHGLSEEYQHVREILAPLQAPIYVIPGNRDECGALRAAFGDHSYLPKDGDFLQYTVEDYSVRLVALDSTAADKPTILLIHHPPFDIGDHYVGGYRRPREAEQLAAVVGRHSQVERLLCGHVHWPTQRQWAGTVATTMASVAVDVRKGIDELRVKDRPMYQLHVMSEKNGLVSQARIVAH